MKYILRGIHLLVVTITAIVIIFLIGLKLITSNISPSAKSLFVTTMLETGALKFMPKIFLSAEEIQSVVDGNSMKDFDIKEDLGLIELSEKNLDKVELIEVKGKSFAAKMIVINDPSRVKISTIENWGKYGVELHKLVEQGDYFAGTNSGSYVQLNKNEGGMPEGVVVSNGELKYNSPQKGMVLVGFDTNHLLRIMPLGGKSVGEIKKIVEQEKIRDAITFYETATYSDNHFVRLLANGIAREYVGEGSGANPRTAIGQREDGSVLLLVTDGRGKDGHLGATAKDLIKVMKDHGAINAANLDGGSSSSMYYKGVYEMPSVTLYYSNSSWLLPTAWVVEKR